MYVGKSFGQKKIKNKQKQIQGLNTSLYIYITVLNSWFLCMLSTVCSAHLLNMGGNLRLVSHHCDFSRGNSNSSFETHSQVLGHLPRF